jgi:uncharacterized membrane protein YfcA
VEWTPIQIALVAAIALTGGTLGGLLGLGGSVFIIPTITFLLGPNYHLYQASALIANVFVASAATRKHRGRGTIRRDLVPVMAAAAAVMALLGVFTSNVINAAWLYIVFGAFLCYASTSEIIGLLRRKPDAPDSPIGATRWRLALATGAIGGFLSGLLGIGAVLAPFLTVNFPVLSHTGCNESGSNSSLLTTSVRASADHSPLSRCSSFFSR